MSMSSLPPVDVRRSGSGWSEKSTADKKTAPAPVSIYDKIFGISRRKKKKEQEEAKNLLNFYDNFQKDLQRALKELLVDDVEQRSWLNLWVRLDPQKSNVMTYSRFCEVFSMKAKCIWTRRVFGIMNSDCTSGVSFSELVNFCATYLILDEESLNIFAFKLLTRRGGMCDENTVLDMQDIKTYIKFKFKSTLKKVNYDKLSMEIIALVEGVPDYGIRLEDLTIYNKKNRSILAFANGILTHLRMCIFGYFFWVERSRQLSKKHAKGLASLTLQKNANSDTEKLVKYLHRFHGIRTRVPKRFRPKKSDEDLRRAESGVPSEIILSSVKSKSRDSEERKSPAKPITRHQPQEQGKRKEGVVSRAAKKIDASMFQLSDDVILKEVDGGIDSPEVFEDLPESQDQVGAPQGDSEPLSRSDDPAGPDTTRSHPEENQQAATQPVARNCEELKPETKPVINNRQSSKVEKESTEAKALLPQLSAKSSSVSKFSFKRFMTFSERGFDDEEEFEEETAEEKAARIASLRYYPIGFKIELLCMTTFDKEFPDIMEARLRKKAEKIQRIKDRIKVDQIKEQRMYGLMTQVLDDLVNQNRGKRIAFGRWLFFVSMIDKSNNPNYKIHYKPSPPEPQIEEGQLEEKVQSKPTSRVGAGLKKMKLGFFGKKKKKNIKAANASKTKKKTVSSDKDESSGMSENGKEVAKSQEDLPEEKTVEEDDDPEFALHRNIIKMTDKIMSKGAEEDAFKDYMDGYKARCMVLPVDRTATIKRESVDFLASFEEGEGDPSKRVIRFGKGVECIARKKQGY